MYSISLDPDEDKRDATIFDGLKRYMISEMSADECKHFKTVTLRNLAKRAQSLKSLRPPRGLNFSLQQQRKYCCATAPLSIAWQLQSAVRMNNESIDRSICFALPVPLRGIHFFMIISNCASCIRRFDQFKFIICFLFDGSRSNEITIRFGCCIVGECIFLDISKAHRENPSHFAGFQFYAFLSHINGVSVAKLF